MVHTTIFLIASLKAESRVLTDCGTTLARADSVQSAAYFGPSEPLSRKRLTSPRSNRNSVVPFATRLSSAMARAPTVLVVLDVEPVCKRPSSDVGFQFEDLVLLCLPPGEARWMEGDLV